MTIAENVRAYSILRPARAVLKHAFHTDPTLTASAPSMAGQSIYDLDGASVSEGKRDERETKREKTD